LLERDPQSKELGFSPALLSHGQVGNKQTGIGFALSTPILYYNLALVKAAGGDPDKLPSSWDEVVALAPPSTGRPTLSVACFLTGPSPAIGLGRVSSSVTVAAC
jgi:maltose-binding protein MalE